MTYNFDPDRWYDNEVTRLGMSRARGDLDEAAFAAAIEELGRRYEAMVKRLDGTYELGSHPHAGTPGPSGA